jgi:hypothetical protein
LAGPLQSIAQPGFLNLIDHPLEVCSSKPHVKRGTFTERGHPLAIRASHGQSCTVLGLLPHVVNPGRRGETGRKSLDVPLEGAGQCLVKIGEIEGEPPLS